MISAVLIVKNEENCLEECLESIKGLDEIIICDTGSEDNTVEIAKKYTDKVFTDYKWNDSMCEARNHALAKATGDWVLSIDADEILESVEAVRKAVETYKDARTIQCNIKPRGGGDKFQFPRLFKRSSEVYWKGAIHNYLSVIDNNTSDVVIHYGYSEAHKLDPNRSLRILGKEVIKDPSLSREKFYLAREYYYRKNWNVAIRWYEDYLETAKWNAEMAEAELQIAKCYLQLKDYANARDHCWKAIQINADFKEALLFMADLMGPKNRERWVAFAEMAENEDVLFVRNKSEMPSKYYEDMFSRSSNMSRYDDILAEVGKMAKGKVLDICAGTGELSKYVADYDGFDFTSQENTKVRKGDAYNENYEGYDTYVALETFEHLDDIKIINKLPDNADIIFSVPNFTDRSHIRTYNERVIRYRYAGLLDIQNITKFYWNTKKWVKEPTNSKYFILLVKAKKYGCKN